jgi:hypothetical protein
VSLDTVTSMAGGRSDDTATGPAGAEPEDRAELDRAAERRGRIQALGATLVAATQGAPDVSEEEFVDEILSGGQS